MINSDIILTTKLMILQLHTTSKKGAARTVPSLTPQPLTRPDDAPRNRAASVNPLSPRHFSRAAAES
ncbi:hypothetical protein JTE90_016695 [Oedothorax gibbosus]|uniref:Uncharacterized protein n=1 Tax=Oedothorax gibbosus TaxID=931172 RepID=A0AAV6V4B2_9ARAC|nr:hypothetical protein JTE90_016695 [Oedothorax gibbosus]